MGVLSAADEALLTKRHLQWTGQKIDPSHKDNPAPIPIVVMIGQDPSDQSPSKEALKPWKGRECATVTNMVDDLWLGRILIERSMRLNASDVILPFPLLDSPNKEARKRAGAARIKYVLDTIASIPDTRPVFILLFGRFAAEWLRKAIESSELLPSCEATTEAVSNEQSNDLLTFQLGTHQVWLAELPHQSPRPRTRKERRVPLRGTLAGAPTVKDETYEEARERRLTHNAACWGSLKRWRKMLYDADSYNAFYMEKVFPEISTPRSVSR